ncbi:UDP-glucose:(heptosyl)LPS alpha-1,3-glucosyltransferase [Candidatus Hakubella thermalkaliphila]|uniref:UDP-glucose:(Heptosyl)LPS alpha-1,3-glucosyltransferase n=1 Tax=Candidatus Hakubella thermalkaliphila TaxID=2754717 RepID=A0A6V8NL77_9ACTN|nr:glycosyltransferase family 4 protein [Candidatus Hakubella thermalkaliphila]MBT9169931.1 Glycogen synthase [Actinomycetota bacterium]GFP20975.1 UDP-glucose:(heptosyl)LPS alpha-1,3-glucosyltransferase [Candidatus Hakubella thermalkaliphila]
MNILRIVYDFPPPWRGLSPGTYELTKAQAELGNEVVVLCGGWPRRKSYSEKNLRAVRLLSALPKIGIILTYAPAVLFSLLRLTRIYKFDLIHGHNFSPLFYHLARKMGMKRKDPYILHMHITTAGRWRQSSPKVGFWTRLEWVLHRFSERIGCQVADNIICVSESVREEVQRFYKADPKKVLVISNGVNTKLFTPNGQKAQVEGMDEEKDIIILFVGVLRERKNLENLILALQFLEKRYKLLVVGTAQEKWYYRNILRMAREKALLDRVFFLGYIPYHELPSYYRLADVLVLPSHYEGSPKVVLEALASGVPAVVSRGYQADRYLESLVHRVEGNNPEETAQVIQEVTKKKGDVDVQVVREKYGWPKVAGQIQDVYSDVLFRSGQQEG